MNKKGFMFVETIVTLSILIVLLVALYNTFTNLLNKEKIGAEYEKKSDRYALFYIKEALMDSEYIETYKDKYVHLPANRLTSSYSINSQSDIQNYNANVAIVTCNSNTAISIARDSASNIPCSHALCEVNNVSQEFKEYVNQLPRGNCKTGAKYIIAGEFMNNHIYDPNGEVISSTYSYAYIFYPNVKAADEE